MEPTETDANPTPHLDETAENDVDYPSDCPNCEFEPEMDGIFLMSEGTDRSNTDFWNSGFEEHEEGIDSVIQCPECSEIVSRTPIPEYFVESMEFVDDSE